MKKLVLILTMIFGFMSMNAQKVLVGTSHHGMYSTMNTENIATSGATPTKGTMYFGSGFESSFELFVTRDIDSTNIEPQLFSMARIGYYRLHFGGITKTLNGLSVTAIIGATTRYIDLGVGLNIRDGKYKHFLGHAAAKYNHNCFTFKVFGEINLSLSPYNVTTYDPQVREYSPYHFVGGIGIAYCLSGQ